MMRRAFVSITTENYHYLSIWLCKSILEFSEYPIHIFCINYHPSDSGLEMPTGVIFHQIEYEIETDESYVKTDNGNFYVDRKTNRPFQIMTRKSEACIRMLDLGYDECCFIDGDSLACPNIDEIFDYTHRIKTTPLMTRGPHEFVMVTGDNGEVRGNPFEGCWPDKDIKLTIEWPLMQFLQVQEDQRDEYRTGNLFIFNQNCRRFLVTLEEFLNVMWKVVDVYYYSPFQDETPMNVLVWKFNGGGLPMSYINLEGFETVEHFFNTSVDTDTLVGDFYKIPKEKSEIKVLHGEKREQELEKILEYLKQLNKAGYYKKID